MDEETKEYCAKKYSIYKEIVTDEDKFKEALETVSVEKKAAIWEAYNWYAWDKDLKKKTKFFFSDEEKEKIVIDPSKMDPKEYIRRWFQIYQLESFPSMDDETGELCEQQYKQWKDIVSDNHRFKAELEISTPEVKMFLWNAFWFYFEKKYSLFRLVRSIHNASVEVQKEQMQRNFDEAMRGLIRHPKEEDN